MYAGSGAHGLEIFTSDDNSNWGQIVIDPEYSPYHHLFTIPEEYIHKKFWKLISNNTNDTTKLSAITPPETFTGKCLHFNSAPPKDSTIIANYKCDVFAKDENHVLDMAVTIQFGEGVEP